MRIDSEEQAWALLDLLVSGEKVEEIEFIQWPILDISIKGDEYQASLNSKQMAALVDLEHIFGRAYSVVAHGAYDKRRLKSDEEEDLQFTTTVKEGSSILETDFTPLVKAFATAVAANPTLSVMCATALGLALVSKPVILKYFETRAKQLEVEEKKLLLSSLQSPSAVERNRINLLEKAIARITKNFPQFSQVIPDAQTAMWRFASASVDADLLTVEGVELNQNDLELLSNRRAARPRSTQERNEICKITFVRKSGASWIVGLEGKNVSMGARFKKPHLTDNKLSKLMRLMASGQQIEAKLEVRIVDKATLSGRLISFKAV